MNPIIVPKNQFRYYYTLLEARNKIAYDELLEGYLSLKSSISVKVDSINDVWEIQKFLLYDVPDIFFIKNVTASYNRLLGTIIVYPEYRFDKTIITNMALQMEEIAGAITKRIRMLPEKEQIRHLHDYLIRTVTYKDLKAPYSHQAPGTLLYGIGVCEGISKAFKYLADRLGIDAIVAVGDAKDENNSEPEIGHAWNIVYLNGDPFHLDITFDYSMSKKNLIRYDYYLLSDLQIEVDHTFENLPPCIISTEYYEEIGCKALNKSQLEELVRSWLTPTESLVFKMPELRGKKEEIAESVMQVVENAVPIKFTMGYNILYSYNLERMIFQVELNRTF